MELVAEGSDVVSMAIDGTAIYWTTGVNSAEPSHRAAQTRRHAISGQGLSKERRMGPGASWRAA
jgi:hypothetical protein